MPATEGEVKLVARVTALEILVRHLLQISASAAPDPATELDGYRERVLASYRAGTVKGFAPVVSDLLTQELTDALDALLSKAVSEMRDDQSPPG